MFWTDEDIHDRREKDEEPDPASSTSTFGSAGEFWPDPVLHFGPTADQLALDLDLDLPFLGEPAYESSQPTTSATPTSPGDDPSGREESTPCTSELSSSSGTPSYGELDFGAYDDLLSALSSPLPNRPLPPPPFLIDPRTLFIPSLDSQPQPHHAFYPPPPSAMDDPVLWSPGPDGAADGATSGGMKQESKERRDKRRATNRASAKAFRARRKSFLQDYQTILDERDAECARLRTEAEALQRESYALGLGRLSEEEKEMGEAMEGIEGG